MHQPHMIYNTGVLLNLKEENKVKADIGSPQIARMWEKQERRGGLSGGDVAPAMGLPSAAR